MDVNALYRDYVDNKLDVYVHLVGFKGDEWGYVILFDGIDIDGHGIVIEFSHEDIKPYTSFECGEEISVKRDLRLDSNTNEKIYIFTGEDSFGKQNYIQLEDYLVDRCC